MPIYRNKTDKVLVLSKYNTTFEPYEEKFIPYQLPQDLIDNNIIEKISDTPNDIIPYTSYHTLAPSEEIEIPVEGYKSITIVFNSQPNDIQNNKLLIYENYINDNNKSIELYYGQVFKEDKLSYEKQYISKYILKADNNNTENINIRIDLEI